MPGQEVAVGTLEKVNHKDCNGSRCDWTAGHGSNSLSNQSYLPMVARDFVASQSGHLYNAQHDHTLSALDVPRVRQVA